ncbi:MAG TPA: hypothetical protein VJ743_02305, partial [Albitalea sp.]|nr:hypothetical protein [Albitalea sp.]
METRRWVMGGAGAAVVIAVAAVVLMGRSSQGQAQAAVNPSPAAKAGAGKEVPLEFTAQEVVRPVRAAMPITIEFSGPLVA